MQHKKWLYNVTSCQLQWQSLTQLKSSAKISMTHDDDIDYINDRVKVYAILNDTKFALGVFLLCSSDKQIIVTTSRDCECYSLLQILLDNKIEQRMQIVAGINIVNEVIRLIGTTNAYSIPTSTKVLATDKIYEIGTSYLEIINDILSAGNYTPLYTDKDGTYITKPYILPQDRTHTVTLKADLSSLVKPVMSDGLDLFNIPNVFVAYTDSIEVAPLSYTYENNRVDSVTSIVNRGRRIVKVQSFDVGTVDELVVKAKQMCDEANSKFAHLELSAALRNDLNLYDDCIWVKIGDIDSKYILYNTAYTCKAGQDMKLKLRKVVDLFV